METEKKRAVFHVPDYDGDNTQWLKSRKKSSIPNKVLVGYPDAAKHKLLSFIKSGIRIVACFLGVLGFYEIGFFLLAGAEIVGIVEELV